MGFFGLRPELESTYKAALAVAQQMGQMAKGSGNPEVLEYLVTDAAAKGQAARTLLISEGRQREWKKFRKSLIKAGRTFLDVPSFNHEYYPFAQKYFEE